MTFVLLLLLYFVLPDLEAAFILFMYLRRSSKVVATDILARPSLRVYN